MNGDGMGLAIKRQDFGRLGILILLFVLIVLLPSCTTQDVKQEQKAAPEEQKLEDFSTKQEINKTTPQEKRPVKEDSPSILEQADNASIIGIPRFFQRRESARVTHISDELINMSYRENNRQVQFKVVNFEQDDGVRKRTIKYCFDKDSIFFKKRDIVHYHISTEVCNTYGKPYVALPIKIERES